MLVCLFTYCVGCVMIGDLYLVVYWFARLGGWLLYKLLMVWWDCCLLYFWYLFCCLYLLGFSCWLSCGLGCLVTGSVVIVC